MKVVLYQGQKKITVDHVFIPDIENVSPILINENIAELTITDPSRCNFLITSLQEELIEEEFYEEIKLRQETVH